MVSRIFAKLLAYEMENKNIIWSHLAGFGAGAIWGLMAPIGKAAMVSGISGLDMVTFRVVGGAICFWLTSLFSVREKVQPRDLLQLFFAGMFAIVCNQCCFTIGLSITSPINASIVATSLPIAALIASAIFLHEKVTWKKVLGIACGVCGALILILGSATAVNAKAGNIVGDILCLCSQCSFAIYLALFKPLVSRYHTITCMKWMFTFASLAIAPFSFREVASIPFADIALVTWLESAFVVLGGTYLAYILMMRAQKNLRPTVVAMYNYVQPITSSVVSVIAGLAIFGMNHLLAVALIVLGVYTVNAAKSK